MRQKKRIIKLTGNPMIIILCCIFCAGTKLFGHAKELELTY